MSSILKRFFDIIIAILMLVCLFPFWLVIFIILHFINKTGVFYIQERIGKKGRVFRVIKFRTLHQEEIISAFSQFLRKTALDELPQLLSILKGDMSFVGPRPLIKEEMEQMKGKEILKERLKISPGLTGVAQVLLVKHEPIEKKFLYDVWYIRNRSLIIDTELILISFLITFLGRWELDIDKLNISGRLKRKIESNL